LQERALPSIKLTKAAIERLRAPDPSGKQRLVWDAELKGFGILISGLTKSKSFVVQRTLPDGRTRRVTIGSVSEIGLDKEGLDKAREEAAALLLQMRKGEDPKAARKSVVAATWTLRHALDEYIARKDLKAGTAVDYRGELQRNLAAWLDRPLRSITPDMVEERHREIQAEVAKRRKLYDAEHFLSKPGGHTANKVFNIFGILWNFVADRDATMPQNPTRRLRQARFKEPRRERMVETDQLPAFYKAVDALPNPIAADAIKLILFTGLRRNEALGLRWSPEIDFQQRVIRLRAARTKAGRKLDLPMSSFVRELLVARRAIGDERGWVFPGNSKMGHFTDFEGIFIQIAQATGIRVSAHDLRRSYLTVAESCDVSPFVLKALVNHTLGGGNTEGYIVMAAERLREPAQRVCDRMMELCGIEPTDGENIARMSQ
jgi:integrase